ncbi:hypothetical protein OsI_12073 [Oryza sativa Indica Group]|uniref:Uncharacterized protein n=1 Tax=Oryza sativa subsp. indica TaxID=39946 RepID=B8AK60_ORYSI|nr:hypothetical protein OsI_12073 [Oryza sativa Indica Group]
MGNASTSLHQVVMLLARPEAEGLGHLPVALALLVGALDLVLVVVVGDPGDHDLAVVHLRRQLRREDHLVLLLLLLLLLLAALPPLRPIAESVCSSGFPLARGGERRRREEEDDNAAA